MWDNLRDRLERENVIKNVESEIHDLKDIWGDDIHSYISCKDFSLSAILDSSPIFRRRSLEFLSEKFAEGVLRKGYEEDGSVYLKIQGNDGLLRTFFVGDVSEYIMPSDGAVHFDFDKI